MSWFRRKPKPTPTPVPPPPPPPVIPPPPPPPPIPVPGAPTFVENFDKGTLDPKIWRVSNWGAVGGGTFAPSQVSLADGMLCLKITTPQRGGPGLGGEIQMLQKFGFGAYEWTARMGSNTATPLGVGVPTSGGVSGLFNWVNDSETEIDFETLGDKPNTLFLSNWNLPQAQGESLNNSNVALPNLYATFNRFKYVWSASKIDYFVNDVLVDSHTTKIPQVPAMVIINHWWSNDPGWGGLAIPGEKRLYVSKFTFTKA